jgi:hypothetical protein
MPIIRRDVSIDSAKSLKRITWRSGYKPNPTAKVFIPSLQLSPTRGESTEIDYFLITAEGLDWKGCVRSTSEYRKR